ncbi:MAG: 3-keto-5-aminohexanoate cleavage protein [Planctomycetes bacterium]|nr:3-keto-5-aminohexanoate cleavage protein [Planctomycetota bacterium]
MPSYEDKVVLTCALTGVLANREQCPGIPYTPVEIAEEAQRAFDAGATVVHIHARNDDGTPTFEPEVFQRIKDEVRARCPVILNFSTGALDDDTTLQERMVREVRPEIAALNMGSMNYGKFSHKRKDFVFDLVFTNPFPKIKRLLLAMNEAGVKPEMECFDTGHTSSADPFREMGLLKSAEQFSFIVNVLGGLPASVEALQLQRGLIPAHAQWEVIGISHCQWRMLGAALVLGGNIRCGLEDHFYLPNGEQASSNGQLCEVAARLTRDVGRELATVEEAREILSLPPL